METKMCCFIGHRKIEKTPRLCKELRDTIISLITGVGVEWYCFGSNSEFDELCLETVTKLQEEYPQIKRVYVRSRKFYLKEEEKEKILQRYDDTIMPSEIKNAGKASYVERNQAMIDAADVCIFYYNPEYAPPVRKKSKNSGIFYWPKSGTTLAYEYATRKNKRIVNLYKES